MIFFRPCGDRSLEYEDAEGRTERETKSRIIKRWEWLIDDEDDSSEREDSATRSTWTMLDDSIREYPHDSSSYDGYFPSDESPIKDDDAPDYEHPYSSWYMDIF